MIFRFFRLFDYTHYIFISL